MRSRDQRLQIVDMQIAVLAHAPPFELRARRLQRQPGRDVGVVVHVGDDDLVARPVASIWPMPRLTRRMNEVAFMPKQISAGLQRVDQQRHALARIGDALVDRDAAAVAAAALDVVRDQMVGHRVEHALRDLRAGGIVQEDEVAGLLQGRKHRPDRLDRESGAFGWRIDAGSRESPAMRSEDGKQCDPRLSASWRP